MNVAQRVIKVCALILSGFLVLLIGVGILSGLSVLGLLAWGDEIVSTGDGERVVSEFTEEIRELDLDVNALSVRIEEASGDVTRVETNSKYVKVAVDNGALKVTEERLGIFGWGSAGELVIYMRKDTELETAKIEMGAGTLDVGSLSARRIDFDLGAGKTWIGNLEARESAEIAGGAGLIELDGGELRNLTLDLGVGKAELRAKLTGGAKIDTGVGKTELNLIGTDYKFSVDKGVGEVTIEGASVNDGATIGEGRTLVDLSAGVGAVEVRMTEE